MKKQLIALKQLDEELLGLKKQAACLRPVQGWVRTLRKTLGMTIRQLAGRLGVGSSRVVKIETSELDGALTIASLQSVAKAFNCQFVYGFVPESSLQEMVEQQAEKVAAEQIKRTEHTMDLEAQSVDRRWAKEQEKELVAELLQGSWKQLWEE